MRDERKLKLMLKLIKGCQLGVRIPLPAPRAGVAQAWQRRPHETQILAPVSVFAAEHRIDRAWANIDELGVQVPSAPLSWRCSSKAEHVDLNMTRGS